MEAKVVLEAEKEELVMVQSFFSSTLIVLPEITRCRCMPPHYGGWERQGAGDASSQTPQYFGSTSKCHGVQVVAKVVLDAGEDEELEIRGCTIAAVKMIL